MRNHVKTKIFYDSDADVLIYEVSDRPIDHADEVGNMIVHFTKDDQPVLVEILEASKFIKQVKPYVQPVVAAT